MRWAPGHYISDWTEDVLQLSNNEHFEVLHVSSAKFWNVFRLISASWKPASACLCSVGTYPPELYLMVSINLDGLTCNARAILTTL